MGSVVKAITKPFQAIGKAVGSAIGTVTGQKGAATQVINEAAPQAVAQPTVVQQSGSADTETGTSSERANRRGKKSLTIRRTNVGGGSGLNI